MEKDTNNTKPGDYQSFKNLKVFSSFETAEAYELINKRKMSPEERIAHVTLLVKKIYDYKTSKYYRIYFDKV